MSGTGRTGPTLPARQRPADGHLRRTSGRQRPQAGSQEGCKGEGWLRSGRDVGRQRGHRAARPRLCHRCRAGHHPAALRARLRLPRPRRQASGPRRARTDPAPRGSARLREGVDLPARERPSAGHRVRCARAQAVSLPPRLGQLAVAGEIRPPAGLRRGAAPPAPPRGPRPQGRGGRARLLARGPHHADRPDLPARGQLGLCRGEQDLRRHHASGAPCEAQGRRGAARLPRQGRQARASGAEGPPPAPHPAGDRGPAGPQPLHLDRRGRARCGAWPRTM